MPNKDFHKIFEEKLHTLETHAKENRGEPVVAASSRGCYLIGIIAQEGDVLLQAELPTEFSNISTGKYCGLLNVGSRCLRLDVNRVYSRNYSVRTLMCNIPLVRETWRYGFGKGCNLVLPRLPEEYSLENLLKKLNSGSVHN